MPLFPLDIVVVPKERIPLHIFEPRYKRMIKDSIKTGDPFGIVLKENVPFSVLVVFFLQNRISLGNIGTHDN